LQVVAAVQGSGGTLAVAVAQVDFVQLLLQLVAVVH
jgi:hypothetical protein